MRRRGRHTGRIAESGARPWLAFILGSLVSTVVLSLLVFTDDGVRWMNDFFTEAWPAYRSLSHGHVLGFLQAAPAYVGSLVLRAPFALLGGALGGSRRVVYFATALPCLLAAPALGAWLSVQPGRKIAGGRFSHVSPLVLCCLNPIVMAAIVFGHPEDVLGSVLCVFAVILAVRGGSGWPGFLLAVALINKSWALVAVPVVFAVMPADRRRALIVMVATTCSVMVPILVARHSGSSAAGAAASLGSGVGTIFLLPQLLWWFGPHAWIVQQAHILLVVVCAAVASTWWVVRGRARTERVDMRDALLLLALIMLLRAALDPWDNLYYQVPFLFAVMAYEAGRAPKLTILFSCLLLLVVPAVGALGSLSPDLHAAAYAAVVLPMIAWLIGRVFVRPAGQMVHAPAREAGRRGLRVTPSASP